MIGQPLLLPVKMNLSDQHRAWLGDYGQRLGYAGIDFEVLNNAVVIRKVPGIIRNHNIAEVFSQLFDAIEKQPRLDIVGWLFSHFGSDTGFDLMKATHLLDQGRALLGEAQLLQQFGVVIEISCHIAQLLDGSASD